MVRFELPQELVEIEEFRVVVMTPEHVFSGTTLALDAPTYTRVDGDSSPASVVLASRAVDVGGESIVEGRQYRIVVVSVPVDPSAYAPTISELSRTIILVDTRAPRPGCEDYADWTTSAYVLPYPEGAAYRVLQGNCSPWVAGHHISKGDGIGYSRYAFDVSMPIGSPVVAIRGGTVVFTLDHRPNYGPLPGNSVWIDHGDGTMGFYAHLDQGGVLVSEGASVEQGQVIASSGASGGLIPGWEHLHFAVHPCTNVVQCPSVPLTFRNTDPNPRGLEFGVIYRAGKR